MKNLIQLNRLYVSLMTGAALLGALNGYAQSQPPGDFVNHFSNSTSGADNSTASWIYWYNGAGTVGLDMTMDAATNASSGSLKVTVPFTLPFRTPDQAAFFGNFDNVGAYDTTIIYDGTLFTNLEFDIRMDPTCPVSATGDFGIIGIGLEDAGTPSGAREAGTVLIPGIASNQWVHLTVPVNKTATYLSTPGVIGVAFTYSTYDNNSQNSFLTNPVTMWIDNVTAKLGPVAVVRPTMSIQKIKQGLNFVQGSISGQFDRQNIRTIGTGVGATYTWVGSATPGTPVIYSFNIGEFKAADLNYHIYFYESAGAGGASAPDYNQTNVLIFQISPASNNVASVASLTWKTNLPQSGTTGTAIQVTNSTLLGNWQLKFTGNTSGSIIAPDATAYPFTIDSGLAAALGNTIYVNFGINPSINDTSILGEHVVISQIGITGTVSPLNTLTSATTDNFLTESSLDTTNTWEVNALTPASIVFVPANTSYSVNWTVPAAGFSLTVNTNLSSTNSWTVLSLPKATLPPGVNTLVPNSSVPPGNNVFFRLAKLTATKLQVLLPGESNAPNTVTGKTGTPTAVTAGDLVPVTINAVDANFNIVASSGDNIHVTSSDGAAILPSDGPLSSGTRSVLVEFLTTGPQTVTATDTTTVSITAGTSSPVTVN